MSDFVSKLTVIFLGMFLSCGAPLKKADDVEPIFANSEPLGFKVSELCGRLTSNQGAPNLQNVDIGLEACTQAGLQAQNYSLNSPIEFASIRADGQKFSSDAGGVANKEEAFLRFQTRAEVWLGKSILNLITNLLPSINDKSQSLFSQGGQSNGGTQKVQMKMKILGQPEFDQKNFKFGINMYIESLRKDNGAIDIRNKFRLDGQMFDKKYVAVTLATTEDADFKTSLIQKGKFVILIVPHAADVYIDTSIDLTFHSVGVDAALKNEITKTMGEALKTIIQQIDSAGSVQQ